MDTYNPISNKLKIKLAGESFMRLTKNSYGQSTKQNRITKYFYKKAPIDECGFSCHKFITDYAVYPGEEYVVKHSEKYDHVTN